MGASYAVGVVRDGRLLLASLEQVMQLRPSLAHLDRGAERAAGDGGAEAIAGEDRSGGAAEAMEEDDASAVQMEPVRVRVCRPLAVTHPACMLRLLVLLLPVALVRNSIAHDANTP